MSAAMKEYNYDTRLTAPHADAREFITKVIQDVTYKKGWVAHFKIDDAGNVWLHWTFTAPNSRAPAVQTNMRSTSWPAGSAEGLTATGIVSALAECALNSEIHESREFFRYKNVRIYNPHASVEALRRVGELEDGDEDIPGVPPQKDPPPVEAPVGLADVHVDGSFDFASLNSYWNPQKPKTDYLKLYREMFPKSVGLLSDSEGWFERAYRDTFATQKQDFASTLLSVDEAPMLVKLDTYEKLALQLKNGPVDKEHARRFRK